MDSTTHHHPIARLGNGGKTFLLLDFSHLIRPDQPISAAADLRSCASGSPACTAGRDRSRASLPVRRKVSVTVTRLSTPGQGPASVGCEIFIAARRACSTLHAPRSRAHPRPRSSTLRIHRIGRARRVVDRLESPVRYVRQFPSTTFFRPSLLTWPRPFHPDFHSGPPAAPTTCRPGTPSTEQCPPPSPTRAWLGGWQAGCPCPPRLWAACPLLPAGACCRPMAATWRAMASRSLQSQCGAQPPDHPRTMAMANAHLSSTSQKPPLPPLPTAHCFACAPATRLLHRDKPLPCHCTPFFYRIPAHYGAGFALLMVADVAQRK